MGHIIGSVHIAGNLQNTGRAEPGLLLPIFGQLFYVCTFFMKNCVTLVAG